MERDESDVHKLLETLNGQMLNPFDTNSHRSRFVICAHMCAYYQSPLILTELSQHNLINVTYLTACYLYQVMMTLHF